MGGQLFTLFRLASIAIAVFTCDEVVRAQPVPVGTLNNIPAGDANSFGSSSLRYNSAGTLYAWDGQYVWQLGSDGTFTSIGQVPGNSADPGPINFSADGETILLGNGGGGQLGGTYSGQIFSLPLAGGTTATPVGNVPDNADFLPVPSTSSIANASATKYFVDGAPGFGSDAEVSVFDASNGIDTPVITVPGASASMALNPTNNCLYVEDGYDYSADGSSFTGEIRSFSLAQIELAITDKTTLNFDSGKLFNVVAGEQSGSGLFFDQEGYLLAGGNGTDGDGGVVAFNPDGSIAQFTDLGGYTTITYNPANDQVLVVPYGEDGLIYDAADLVPEPATLGLVAFGGLLLPRRKARSASRSGLAAASSASRSYR